MAENFMKYHSPLSEETMKIRRNSVLVSSLCVFVGVTQQIPSQFSLLGLSFETIEEQSILGWFLFSISAYLLIHFIFVASVETAKWIHPLLTKRITKKELLDHPAFSEEDFMDFDPWGLFEGQDRSEIAKKIGRQSKKVAESKLKPLYIMVYGQLVIEMAIPILIGCFGLFKLAQLITSLASGTN